MFAARTSVRVVLGLFAGALVSCIEGPDIDLSGLSSLGISIDLSDLAALEPELAVGSSPWSPDGQSLVVPCLDPQDRLRAPVGLLLLPLDGTAPRALLEGKVTGASFSPDGKRIAYHDVASSNWSLAWSSADGSERSPSTLDACFPAWSPDGGWIAATRNDVETSLLVSADGATQIDLGPGVMPVWSPFGGRIALGVMEQDEGWIEIVNRDGRERRRLTHGWTPSWSPDGDWLVFVDDAGEMSVFKIAADGSQRLHLAAGLAPRWSPAGDRILFTRLHGDTGDLLTIRPDGSEERVLALDARAGRWSPDGSRVAFLRDASFFVVNADGSGERSLGSPSVESQ